MDQLFMEPPVMDEGLPCDDLLEYGLELYAIATFFHCWIWRRWFPVLCAS